MRRCIVRSETKLLSRFPNRSGSFLSAHYGDKLVQPELAATLKRIRDRGASDFYDGETAQKLAAAMAANGGLITLADLKAYQAEESEPLRGHYHGDEIITAPPPSAGGVGLLQMLGMLEGSGYEKTGAGSAASIHYVAEVMRRFLSPIAANISAIPISTKYRLASCWIPNTSRAAATASIRCTPRPALRFARATSAFEKAPRPRTSTSWTARETPSR